MGQNICLRVRRNFPVRWLLPMLESNVKFVHWLPTTRMHKLAIVATLQDSSGSLFTMVSLSSTPCSFVFSSDYVHSATATLGGHYIQRQLYWVAATFSDSYIGWPLHSATAILGGRYIQRQLHWVAATFSDSYIGWPLHSATATLSGSYIQ